MSFLTFLLRKANGPLFLPIATELVLKNGFVPASLVLAAQKRKRNSVPIPFRGKLPRWRELYLARSVDNLVLYSSHDMHVTHVLNQQIYMTSG